MTAVLPRASAFSDREPLPPSRGPAPTQQPRASQSAGGALPRAGGFVERDGEYDNECRRYAEDHPPLVPSLPPQSPQRCPPNQVQIQVYEVAGFGRLNEANTSTLGGAFHAGVEVYGREWSYGGGSGRGAGVICDMPRKNKQHRFRETVRMPCTRLSDGEVALILGELVDTWLPQDYHWLHRNCLAFANEFCSRLGVGPIPPWIDRFARGAAVADTGVKAVAAGAQGIAHGAQSVVSLFTNAVNGAEQCGQCSAGNKVPRGMSDISAIPAVTAGPKVRESAADRYLQGQRRAIPDLPSRPVTQCYSDRFGEIAAQQACYTRPLSARSKDGDAHGGSGPPGSGRANPTVPPDVAARPSSHRALGAGGAAGAPEHSARLSARDELSRARGGSGRHSDLPEPPPPVVDSRSRTSRSSAKADDVQAL